MNFMESNEIVIGEEFVDGCIIPNEVEKSRFDVSVFSKRDLSNLQADISHTTRPSYSSGPPSNVGTKARGKLKADHWKALIEFELPVSIMKRWSSPSARSHPDYDARAALVCCTMLLACSIRQATAHSTSLERKDKYTQYMHAYLAKLLHICPGIRLRPNHHNALHLGDFLLRFGPIQGWWMFPFERVIGVLQQTNTNSKLGSSFCIRRTSRKLIPFQVNWNVQCWNPFAQQRTSRLS